MNEARPQSMSSFWMPFTNNRDFKANPRLLVSADGVYYKDVDRNQVLGGIAGNRKPYGVLLPGVDHLPHTHNLEKNAYTRGEPEYGAHLADELERIVTLHDASTIAAVIVEPVAGSTGVLVPPKGYLKRLRELCTKHGILLIFDEVITGFGRLATPFATDYFDVEPDMMTTAKGLTNGTIPMGAVFSKKF